jgi:hypothetical protein
MHITIPRRGAAKCGLRENPGKRPCASAKNDANDAGRFDFDEIHIRIVVGKIENRVKRRMFLALIVEIRTHAEEETASRGHEVYAQGADKSAERQKN